MKDVLYIKTRLGDVQAQPVPVDHDYLTKHDTRLKILFWAYNNGQGRTEQELKNKLERINEELISLQYGNIHGLQLKLVELRKSEIENLLR